VPESLTGIPGTYPFDLATARRGYALNRLGISLTDSANRAAYLADEDAYLDRFALSAEQRAAVKARDWLTLVKQGANIYYVFKLTGLHGAPAPMAELGAAQVGMSREEFARANLERARS
jgi:protocatechuate 4,5-dioxygenase alpha chain